MTILAALIFGAFLGAYQARRRHGNRLDMAQYAAVYGLIFATIALFISVFIARMG